MAIWSGKGLTKKVQVKVKVIKLEGLMIKDRASAKIAVGVKWDYGSLKAGGISSLYKKNDQGRTKEIGVVKLGVNPIEWNEEFDHICTFGSISKELVTFNLLYGDNEEPSSSSSRTKMQVIGKVSLNLGELASNLEGQIEQKVPISYEVDGFAMVANLVVIVSFYEMKNHAHSRTMSSDEAFGSEQNSSDLAKFLTRSKSQGPNTLPRKEKAKKNKIPSLFRQLSWKSKGESSATLFSNDNYVVVASSTRRGEPNAMTEFGPTTSSEAQLDLVKKGGFWKWKRRKSMKKGVNSETPGLEADTSNDPGTWQMRETVSRDRKTKLNAEVFFASYDQRSEKAAGESACAAIVAVIAHWLQLHPYIMLSGPDFDRLIIEGSSEWRKLCKEETHKDFFPDQHFDLETILRAELRPLIVHPDNSHFGFFHPEEFDHLKGAKSFDEIWDDINDNVTDFEPKVYIVRWNDHFFIMKIEANANYIIDSLGERLYEGCNQAYILKFDDSTVMYAKEEEEREGGEDKVICRGKECCRDYMKRFLAAIPVRELKEQEAKGKTVDMFVLHQRLLIDFHLSTPSSSNSTANTSTAGSPNNTSPLFLVD